MYVFLSSIFPGKVSCKLSVPLFLGVTLSEAPVQKLLSWKDLVTHQWNKKWEASSQKLLKEFQSSYVFFFDIYFWMAQKKQRSLSQATKSLLHHGIRMPNISIDRNDVPEFVWCLSEFCWDSSSKSHQIIMKTTRQLNWKSHHDKENELLCQTSSLAEDGETGIFYPSKDDKIRCIPHHRVDYESHWNVMPGKDQVIF